MNILLQALVLDSIPMPATPPVNKTFGRGFQGNAGERGQQNASRKAAGTQHPLAPIAGGTAEQQSTDIENQAFSGNAAKSRPQLQMAASPAQQRAEAAERKTRKSQAPSHFTGRLNLKRTQRQ